MKIYRSFHSYLKSTYGTAVRRICVDGGFTCPNRDGTVGVGGCIFCGERGAGEHLPKEAPVRAQVETYFSTNPKWKKYILYFQNFSGTYAPVEVLRARYDEGLSVDPRIAVLSVGTRPDCIDEEIASLLESYLDRVDVWVELGLQTSKEETARFCNIGYTRQRFEEAVGILHRHHIPVVVHLLLGLPGETPEDWVRTADYLADFPIFGVKIHSLYVTEGTALAELYRAGSYVPLTEEACIEGVISVLTHLDPNIVMQRITGDAPEELLLAPSWNRDKDYLIEEIRRRMEERGLSQGMYFRKHRDLEG